MYLGSLIAFLATAALILALRPLAVATGLVDIPNERKSHRRPTPLVGGLAIYLGLAAAWIVAPAETAAGSGPAVASFFAAGALLVGVGVVDDFLDLSPAVRFVAQIVAAAIMIWGGGVVLADLGGMTPGGDTLHLGWLAVPFTVFATLGIINALNMCDGLDGLSGSLALVSLTGLFVAGLLWGGAEAVTMLPLVGAAVIAFLCFNLRHPRRQHASVFMGDAGSMFLGFVLTWYAISLSQEGTTGAGRSIPPAAALWFVMVPIFDAVAMMLRRLIRGRSPFAPDREHLHHVFLLAGFSVNQTVFIMAAIAFGGMLVGLASIHWQVPELVVAGAFLLLGLGYFSMIMRAWRVMRFLQRSICRRRSSGDRRRGVDPAYAGPERRSGRDRRRMAQAAGQAAGRRPHAGAGTSPALVTQRRAASRS